jgi:hypothetical protein
LDDSLVGCGLKACGDGLFDEGEDLVFDGRVEEIVRMEGDAKDGVFSGAGIEVSVPNE